ncbi:hypothetical protein NL676_009427 [Syzygium grande]|nr:hypothetical protein NL676_009427 [Syzygium grande]
MKTRRRIFALLGLRRIIWARSRLGYCASSEFETILGTYLTSTARIHAKDRSLHEGTIIGAFNGEFWGMFASHQVVGNLVSLAVLREETDGRECKRNEITVHCVSLQYDLRHHTYGCRKHLFGISLSSLGLWDF